MKTRKVLLFISLFLLIAILAQPAIASQKIAIAEFETNNYKLREFEDDLNQYLLDYIIQYFDDDVIEIKERLRYMDILRERALSSSRRRELRRNLEADFLILPRIDNLKVKEASSLTLSIFSSENEDFKVNIGMKKIIADLSISARIVDLRTGSIKDGFKVEKDEAFEIGSIKINRENVFRERGTKISSEVFKPASEELALLILSEMKDLDKEYKRERAEVVEVSPYGIEDYIVANLRKDANNFRKGRIITVYKTGKVGGKIPIAKGEIIERDDNYITIQIVDKKEEVEIKKGDIVNTEY